MLTFTALTDSVATATPDGTVKIADRYQWLSNSELKKIEQIEECYRKWIAYRADDLCEDRWYGFTRSLHTLTIREQMAELEDEATGISRMPLTVGSRRAAIKQFGVANHKKGKQRGRGNLPHTQRLATARSRSHSRAKEPLKELRRSGFRLLA